MKSKILSLFFCLLVNVSWSQLESYLYFSKIEKPTEKWHNLLLEESVLGRAKSDLSDLRIICVNGDDTLEAPYLLDENTESSALVKDLTFEVSTNKEAKKTYLSARFTHKIPLTKLKLDIENEFDYHRQVLIYGSLDSISEDKYDHAELIYSDFLNSSDTASLNLDQIYVKHLLIVIENKDNIPLKINNLSAFYKKIFLTARFDFEDNYFLCYGNEFADFPEYDLDYFRDKIPSKLTNLTYEVLKDEISPKDLSKIKEEPTPAWLWLSLSGIVLLLLLFTLKMMRKKEG
jgi:hypothetical protein